jgi:hypothetical protein
MKIVSGGQTGVDRAALDAAIAMGVEHSGWRPRGRLAEDGRIPERYRLQETQSPDYPPRTQQNVLDSDATLILYRGWLSGGTELTFRLARDHQRPCLTVDLDWKPDPAHAVAWLRTQGVAVLNVAGPRESQSPGITALARRFVMEMLQSL